MAITARQFTFITVRLIAAYFAFVCVQNLPYYFLTQVTIPPDDPILMRDAVLSLLVWSAGPIIAVVLWRRADRFAAFVLRDAPSPAAGANYHSWEQSALALFGVLILLDILPVLVNYAAAYAQWANRPPETATFETFFGVHLLPAQVAAHACQLGLSLFLIFRAPTAWSWLKSLQDKSMSQAVRDLRELGVAREGRSGQRNLKREPPKGRLGRRAVTRRTKRIA